MMYRLCIGYVLDRTIENEKLAHLVAYLVAHLVAYRKEISTSCSLSKRNHHTTNQRANKMRPPDIDWLSLLDNPASGLVSNGISHLGYRVACLLARIPSPLVKSISYKPAGRPARRSTGESVWLIHIKTRTDFCGEIIRVTF